MVKSLIPHLLLALTLCTASVLAQDSSSAITTGKNGRVVSFKNDVLPIIKKQCLPCHAEDNFNPSELSLDSHELLMAGGKHGVAVVPGKSKESVLLQKFGPRPPFGDRMPLDPKKKKGELSMKSLSEEEINIISNWIDQGAKNN